MDINKVHKIMEELDYNEWMYYYPHDLVAAVWENPRVVYTDKFEMCMKELEEACAKQGIPIVVFDAGHCNNPPGIQVTLTKEDVESLLRA